jgi:hypothetical protein
MATSAGRACTPGIERSRSGDAQGEAATGGPAGGLASSVGSVPFTHPTLGSGEPDARPRRQVVDDGRACGRPFQDAAALLLDPEEPDEPDPAEPDDDDPDDVLDPEEPVDEPDPDESEEDDDATFCSLLPLSFPSLVAAFGFSRLSVR